MQRVWHKERLSSRQEYGLKTYNQSGQNSREGDAMAENLIRGGGIKTLFEAERRIKAAGANKDGSDVKLSASGQDETSEIKEPQE